MDRWPMYLADALRGAANLHLLPLINVEARPSLNDTATAATSCQLRMDVAEDGSKLQTFTADSCSRVRTEVVRAHL